MKLKTGRYLGVGVVACSVLLFVSGAVTAQTIENPKTAEFTASADHAAVANGVSVLTNYTLAIFASTAPTVPVASQSLGKPTPNASNVIVWTGLPNMLATVPVGTYIARVAAVGPGGTSTSLDSNPFSVTTRVPASPGTPVVK